MIETGSEMVTTPRLGDLKNERLIILPHTTKHLPITTFRIPLIDVPGEL